jgi:hypothetical protein
MNLETSFSILGLDPEVDDAQAKLAYKAQVRRWHPDQFPEGSATKARAEEQLKQINIAYARVNTHLAFHRPDPRIAAADPPSRPPEDTGRRTVMPGEKSKKRSWVDHLFDTLNALAGKPAGKSTPPPDDGKNANRRKTFDQVLDELSGGNTTPRPKRQSRIHSAPPRRATAGYRSYPRRGSTVDALSGAESPGPVKPVGRVRGIGRSR